MNSALEAMTTGDRLARRGVGRVAAGRSGATTPPAIGDCLVSFCRSGALAGGAARKEKWRLDEKSFDALLNYLDADRERAGEKYEKIRQKLLSFFRGRGCWNDAELADDTIDRVSRRIGEGEDVRDLMSFILGFARKVASEHYGKTRQAKPVPLHEISELEQPSDVYTQKELEDDRRLRCIERCIKRLRPDDRELILQWHQFDKAKKIESKERLAGLRTVSLGTLRTQACRARQRLRKLVYESLAESGLHETFSTAFLNSKSIV